MDGDFYQGDLYVGLKESAFQHSSILRHMAENEKILENNLFKPIEAHYHDGGSDHSVRHPKAQIILFGYALKRRLDAFISLQTTPFAIPWNAKCRYLILLGRESELWEKKRLVLRKKTLKNCSQFKRYLRSSKEAPWVKGGITWCCWTY